MDGQQPDSRGPQLSNLKPASGQDARATSQEFGSGEDGRNPSNEPPAASSYLMRRALEKEAARDVYNYRDLSQDASRRSRVGLQATDRPISYPTNMTNMTHDHIIVSPESSGNVNRRTTAPDPDQPALSNNETSNRGQSWRASWVMDKSQPRSAFGTASGADALASQERQPAGQHDLLQQQDQHDQ